MKPAYSCAALSVHPGAAFVHYEEIVRPYMPELRQYCLYLSGSVWDGEDLYQETLLKSLRYYRRAGDIRNAKPFLFRVARNLWIDEYRARGRKRQSEPETEGHAADIGYCEIHGWMEWAAATLSERHLAVWLLADYFGYTMYEIAQRLDTTMPAVRSMLHRARERLRARRGSDAAAIPVPDRKPRAGARVAPGQVDEWVRCIMSDNPAPLFRTAM